MCCIGGFRGQPPGHIPYDTKSHPFAVAKRKLNHDSYVNKSGSITPLTVLKSCSTGALSQETPGLRPMKPRSSVPGDSGAPSQGDLGASSQETPGASS